MIKISAAVLALCLAAALLWAVVLSEDPGDSPLYAERQQWYVELLGAQGALSSGPDGSGVRVAVLDSGLRPDHDAFAGADIEPGYNYLDDNDDVTDHDGHGTFVTGVICAGMEDAGVAGLAPGVTVVPLKCFDGETASLGPVAQAIRDAVDVYDCQVINMSWGLERDTELLRSAVDYAWSKGAVLIAAAGNSPEECLYPAAYDNVIGVGAVNLHGEPASFTPGGGVADVAAPGVEIAGPSITGSGAVGTRTGTSYATPIVTALAALALEADPELESGALAELLLDTAEDIGAPDEAGSGVVSFSGLLARLE